MKLFKWIVKIRIKDLTSEEKIIYLANQLIKECQKNGFRLRKQKDYMNINISAHNIDSENPLLEVWHYPEDLNKRDKVEGILKIKIK